MTDSEGPEAEPEVQLLFSVLRFAAAVVLAAAIVNFSEIYAHIPDRVELGPRTVAIRFDPVALDPAGFGGLELAGAWSVSAPDPRFGGLSAIALDKGGLLALSDSGVIFRFPKPGLVHPAVRIDEISDGPGKAGFKKNRDSESLLRDVAGGGWWVGFENRNRVWLFDPQFKQVRARFRIGRGWPRTGFEAIARSDGRMVLIPESGRKLLSVGPGGSQWVSLPVRPVSDATSLPDGSLLVVERGLSLDGLHNRLVQVRRQGSGYVPVRAIPLGVGRFDNIEGVAVERAAADGLRLWLITDDNHQWPQRTLLLALDWPPARDGATQG